MLLTIDQLGGLSLSLMSFESFMEVGAVVGEGGQASLLAAGKEKVVAWMLRRRDPKRVHATSPPFLILNEALAVVEKA